MSQTKKLNYLLRDIPHVLWLNFTRIAEGEHITIRELLFRLIKEEVRKSPGTFAKKKEERA